MYTLGINAAFHDSAACLVHDGRVLAAAEDERFTRIKHGKRPVPFSAYVLPYDAVDYCLAEAGITLADVDHIAYSFDPEELLNGNGAAPTIELPLRPSAQKVSGECASPWDPLFLSYIVNAPRQLADGAPHHLMARFRGVRHDGPFSWHYVEHHLAHEASAFLASPFDECAVLTLDGRGERATTTHGVYRDGRYRRLKQVNIPHSLGLMYEEVTSYLGFLRSSDEYKVMALASFGNPEYLDEFRKLVRADGEGGYKIAPLELERRFGPPRLRGMPMEERHIAVAASLQAILEETVLDLVRWLQRVSGMTNLAMAGGVALNCVMNARIRDRGPFKRVWVQPAAGDAGTALGAALWIDYRQRGEPSHHWQMDHAFLGPQYDDDQIEMHLKRAKLSYRKLEDVAHSGAQLLAQNKVLGWYQGRMEFGPRALGARSILASPLDASMQQRLNDIKDREDFRPVAPVVLEEALGDWFANAQANDGQAPFMLFIYDVLPEREHLIPAVKHVDGTARVQTINRNQNPRYYDLIRRFGERTGVPMLVNTSFNTRSEPIVCTPRDAVETFYSAPLDALIIGSFLLEKEPT
jgi:carbamoyltransferase